MEYVHGVDLRELLAAAMLKKTAVDYAAAMSIVSAAAAGLDHAHRRCQPRRSPAAPRPSRRLAVEYHGHLRRLGEGRRLRHREHDAVVGRQPSPAPSAARRATCRPSSASADPVDHRTDVFALGVVLYELTTGERCFHGKTDFERMLAVTRGDYVRPSSLIADYPPELEQLVCTALAIDQNHRYSSAAAMIEALEHVAIGRGCGPGRQGDRADDERGLRRRR